MGEMEKEIKDIVDSINDYINGNDTEENYKVILNVVDGLHEYIKLTKKNKLRGNIYLLSIKDCYIYYYTISYERRYI